jgi:hypothetical protein
VAEKQISLTDTDPTIFAKCPRCSVTGLGVVVGKNFQKAYTRKQWARGQACDNCGFLMAFMYEVK